MHYSIQMGNLDENQGEQHYYIIALHITLHYFNMAVSYDSKC